MKTRILILMALSCIAASCSKEVLKTSGATLGERIVSADAGEFPVIITTSGVWSASSLSDWITVDGSLHKDQGSFTVSYESNISYYGKTCFNRLGKIVVSTYDGAQADTLILKQRGLEPYLSFAADNAVAIEGGMASVPAQSNFSDAERSHLSFSTDASWISEISWGRDGRSLSFRTQEGTQQRSAVIEVVFVPEWGDAFRAECHITQK